MATEREEKHVIRRVMKLLLLLAAAAAQLAHAQLVTGRLTTSFYTFDRFDTVGSSKTYLRAFQSVQLSATQGEISLHTYLQGAVNGTNQFGDIGRVRFYNLYLRMANIAKIVDVDLGRQAIYAGVGNGTIDGLSARARLWDNQITLAGYGGANVNIDYTGVQKDWHDNLNVGGQLITTLVSDMRVGLSYMNRHEQLDPYWTLRARDTTYSAIPFYIANSSTSQQLGSADVSYSYGELISAYGRYDYDFNLKQTSRGQGALRLNVTRSLTVTGDVIYRQPQIPYNSIFWAFASSATTEAEGGLEYGFTPLFRAFAKLGLVSYSGDQSTSWTAGLNTGYGSFSYSGSSGYAGELQSLNIQGAYPVLDRKVVPSVGLSYSSYKLSADEATENALALLLGATVRPINCFSFDLQGQWMKNSVYNRDMRLQLRLMYWFAQRMSLFSEEVK
ncbi:MAG TPA: hypothetical protein VL126_15925 [Bacteroidota bacterium]|nr:hypothetical protein [Bacteroidota bacterium]